MGIYMDHSFGKVYYRVLNDRNGCLSVSLTKRSQAKPSWNKSATATIFGEDVQKTSLLAG